VLLPPPRSIWFIISSHAYWREARAPIAMSLLDLWKYSPDELLRKHLWQVIAFAGTGKLIDGGDTSAELREILSNVPSQALSAWGHEATQGKFPDSGLALQDIVNEIGRRLGFSVSPGTYRGVGGKLYDGVWKCGTGHRLIVETKTSDNFTIDLNKLADYRRLLPVSVNITEDDPSILLVLGRQDTGDFEDRIKGSRYAFVMRVITVDALLRLLALKDAAEDEGTLPNFSERLTAVFTSPRVIALDPVVDFVASAPVLPLACPQSIPLEGIAWNDAAMDDNTVQAVLSLVRAAGASGIRSRHLQRRFPRLVGKRFREALGHLTKGGHLRVERRGRQVIVMMGEAAFKDEVLLGLAQLYEEGNLGGLGFRALAQEKGFADDLADRVAAELRAEGSVEPKGVFPDPIRFTDAGYQKYLPPIRSLREMRTRAR